MRQVQTDKYSLAWFKLAECVTRKEKERALGVYRLLAHSLPDAAFAVQLEGDLLLAFQDIDGAREKYRQASQLYAKQSKIAQALVVYEHVVALSKSTNTELEHILQLSKSLKLTQKILTYAVMLLELQCKYKEFEQCESILNEYAPLLDAQQKNSLYRSLVLSLIKFHAPIEVIRPVLHTWLDSLVHHDDAMALQRVLGELHMLNPEIHHEATVFLDTK